VPPQELEEEIKRAGQVATFVQADVTSTGDFERIAQTAEQLYGGVDVLVSNAGLVGKLLTLSDKQSLDDFDRVFDINVKGTVRGLQTFVPLLKKRGQGVVINISSAASAVTVC
jgi:3-oxoacyl-[acyl-carrier protein] reductase